MQMVMVFVDADEVSGCTDSFASNYDASATDDDGSCIFECFPVTIDFLGMLTLMKTHGHYMNYKMD